MYHSPRVVNMDTLKIIADTTISLSVRPRILMAFHTFTDSRRSSNPKHPYTMVVLRNKATLEPDHTNRSRMARISPHIAMQDHQRSPFKVWFQASL